VRVALGSDEEADLVSSVEKYLESRGHEVARLTGPGPLPWPEVGFAVGRAVASGGADLGVVCCWTGTGVCMAAGRVPGIRPALCGDAETAAGARRYNDANVLALSLRATSAPVAQEILDAFLGNSPDPDEAENIARLSQASQP
jgi:ribose 5-phosphate isomerase B